MVSGFVVEIVDKVEGRPPIPKSGAGLLTPNLNGPKKKLNIFYLELEHFRKIDISLLFNGFSFVILVVAVVGTGNDDDGLVVISDKLNLGPFEKIDLVGVVVVGGNVFIIVVCDGGGGAFADVEN